MELILAYIVGLYFSAKAGVLQGLALLVGIDGLGNWELELESQGCCLSLTRPDTYHHHHMWSKSTLISGASYAQCSNLMMLPF